MIALENEMENREKVVEVRNQLLPYFLLINRLYPIDEDLEKCGGVVVKNKKEIQDIIKDKPIKYFR